MKKRKVGSVNFDILYITFNKYKPGYVAFSMENCYKFIIRYFWLNEGLYTDNRTIPFSVYIEDYVKDFYKKRYDYDLFVRVVSYG